MAITDKAPVMKETAVNRAIVRISGCVGMLSNSGSLNDIVYLFDSTKFPERSYTII